MSDTPISQPEDVVVMFVEAWNQRDPVTLAALFDSDAEFVNVTGLWWHTREEMRKAHAYGLTRIFKESVLTATDVRVKWLSDEIAVVHARMTLAGQSSVDDIIAPRQRSNVMSFVVLTTQGGRAAGGDEGGRVAVLHRRRERRSVGPHSAEHCVPEGVPAVAGGDARGRPGAARASE